MFKKLKLENHISSLRPPEFDGKIPPLHAWLLKYDINKYIHVVLLHDRLDLLEAYDLSGFYGVPAGNNGRS